MMKIGILGGTGFIGTQLTKELIKWGDSITIYSRGNRLPFELQTSQVKLVTTTQPTAEQLDGIEVLINLAGEPVVGYWSEDKKKKIVESRVDFSRKLMETLSSMKTKPRIFIAGSAIGIYGMYPGFHPNYSESAPHGTDFLAKTCEDWEKESLKAKSMDIRTYIIRTGIVLSKDDGALKKMLPSFYLFAGGKIGTGEQMMSWIHIKDLVAVFIFLINNSNPKGDGVYNLTAPNSERNNDFSNTLANTLHRPCWMTVPSFVLKTMFGEGSVILTKGQNVYPERLLKEGFKFQFPKLEEALKDIFNEK